MASSPLPQESMIGELTIRYLDYLRIIKNSSVHTIRNYGIDLRFFETYFKEEKLEIALEEISRKTIRGYLAWLHAQTLNKKTVARRLSSLRSFFKYLQRQKLISHNPVEEIDNPKLDKSLPLSISYQSSSLSLSLRPDKSPDIVEVDCAWQREDGTWSTDGCEQTNFEAINRRDFSPTAQ